MNRVYTTKERILQLCPPKTDTQSADWEATYWDDTIAWASEKVDTYVGPGYPLVYNDNKQRFPNVTDVPATPALINETAAKFGSYRVGTRLKQVNQGRGEDPIAIRNFNSARKSCIEIKEGQSNIIIDGVDLTEATRPKVEYAAPDEVFSEEEFENLK